VDVAGFTEKATNDPTKVAYIVLEVAAMGRPAPAAARRWRRLRERPCRVAASYGIRRQVETGDPLNRRRRNGRTLSLSIFALWAKRRGPQRTTGDWSGMVCCSTRLPGSPSPRRLRRSSSAPPTGSRSTAGTRGTYCCIPACCVPAATAPPAPARPCVCGCLTHAGTPRQPGWECVVVTVGRDQRNEYATVTIAKPSNSVFPLSDSCSYLYRDDVGAPCRSSSVRRPV